MAKLKSSGQTNMKKSTKNKTQTKKTKVKPENHSDLNYYTCCYCRQKFPDKSALSFHLYHHLKIFHAPSTALLDHAGLVTAKKLFQNQNHPYFCAKCGKSFFNLVKSKQHCTSSHRGQSRVICLLFHKGKISDERKMLTFDEFAKEDRYIEYETSAQPGLTPDTIPEVTTLHPEVFMKDIMLLNGKEKEELMSVYGTKKWSFAY